MNACYQTEYKSGLKFPENVWCGLALKQSLVMAKLGIKASTTLFIGWYGLFATDQFQKGFKYYIAAITHRVFYLSIYGWARKWITSMMQWQKAAILRGIKISPIAKEAILFLEKIAYSTLKESVYAKHAAGQPRNGFILDIESGY